MKTSAIPHLPGVNQDKVFGRRSRLRRMKQRILGKIEDSTNRNMFTPIVKKNSGKTGNESFGGNISQVILH